MNLKNLAGALAVALLAAIPLFGHLSELPIQRWDESRLAVNALEMYYNHNWLVPTHMGQPEMWNTKPPLMLWLQVLAMHVVGTNELAVRLPSALAAMATCMFIYWFLAIKMKNRLAALAAPAILVAYEGYVCLHGTRTGDYDSLLTFFSTAFILYYYLYLLEGKPRYILLTAIMLSLACFTKGIQPLIFVPALLLGTLLHGRIKTLFTAKEFYIGMLIFILLVPGYYLLREQYNNGYIEAVAENELGGRFFETIENHKADWPYYFGVLYDTGPVVLFLALMSLNMVWAVNNSTSALVRYLVLAILFFTVTLSFAQTKLPWYMVPVYPLLCLLAGIAVYSIVAQIKEKGPRGNLKYIIPVLTFGIYYWLSYNAVLDKALHPKVDLQDRELAIMSYLQKQDRTGWRWGDAYMLNSEHRQDLVWYIGVSPAMSFREMKELTAGNKIILFTDEADQQLREQYKCRMLDRWYGVRVYQVLGKKYIEGTLDDSPNL